LRGTCGEVGRQHRGALRAYASAHPFELGKGGDPLWPVSDRGTRPGPCVEVPVEYGATAGSLCEAAGGSGAVSRQRRPGDVLGSGFCISVRVSPGSSAEVLLGAGLQRARRREPWRLRVLYGG